MVPLRDRRVTAYQVVSCWLEHRYTMLVSLTELSFSFSINMERFLIEVLVSVSRACNVHILRRPIRTGYTTAISKVLF